MSPEQPRKGKSNEKQKAKEAERRIQFSEVTFAALTGEASGEHLLVPGGNRGYTSGMYGEDGRERAIRDLAEGGFVIDLRPLADDPLIFKWVMQAPMPNGRIEGDEINRMTSDERKAAGEMATSPFGLQGAFRDLALLAAAKIGEPTDGGAGAFDNVSAKYRAAWWGAKGALIGRRVGDAILWSNGTKQEIKPVAAPGQEGTQSRR